LENRSFQLAARDIINLSLNSYSPRQPVYWNCWLRIISASWHDQ
jgi:hypothetical protein